MIEVVNKSWLFGSVVYTRVGDVSRIDFFGMMIYGRVLNARRLLGVSWSTK